jgi:hypothetical protein
LKDILWAGSAKYQTTKVSYAECVSTLLYKISYLFLSTKFSK